MVDERSSPQSGSTSSPLDLIAHSLTNFHFNFIHQISSFFTSSSLSKFWLESRTFSFILEMETSTIHLLVFLFLWLSSTSVSKRYNNILCQSWVFLPGCFVCVCLWECVWLLLHRHCCCLHSNTLLPPSDTDWSFFFRRRRRHRECSCTWPTCTSSAASSPRPTSTPPTTTATCGRSLRTLW